MFLSKIFGDPNAKVLKKLQPLVLEINKLEPRFKKFKDADFPVFTEKLKKKLKDGESLESILPPAFAACREASLRAIGERHYDAQLLAGIVLHQGKIAEQKTGEGKTLSATLAVYLNALAGHGAHIVTVNDYLARRDSEWMGPIYDFLGLSVASIQHEKAMRYQGIRETHEISKQVEMGDSANSRLREITRREAYLCDITYGTNNEFGFDYLRDNMVWDKSQMVQRDLHYAIVDEIDSILIDEARTPLIISAPDMESTDKYYEFSRIVPRLRENQDYNVDEKLQAVALTEKGIAKLEEILAVKNIYEERGIATVHHIEQALRAQALFRRDRDYVVRDGEVIIVDQFTGRLMPGRRYSEGLHQAIEAKENVAVQKESKTLGTITFQNYFRLYKKLSGMTGTAVTSAEEFAKVYNLEVLVIPTNKPMIRQDLADVVYKTSDGKFRAVAGEIKKRHITGQPVLVGTISIEKNEILSEMLAREGVEHEVLNAKNHEREAKIIAAAGQKGAVTIATNMAGRGTDIKLGEGVQKLGGLHVLGTERHEARRIDNQLRGRSGRQGDPGSSQFFVSLEDDLMRIFGGGRIKSLMDRLHLPADQPIQNRVLTHSLESAQAKVEGNNFDQRKHLVEYDDVLNKQREVFYKKRREILEDGEELKNAILKMIEEEIEYIVTVHTMGDKENYWDLKEICENMYALLPLDTMPGISREDLCAVLEKMAGDGLAAGAIGRTKIIEYLVKIAGEFYSKREQDLTPTAMRQVEKVVSLRVMDTIWTEHLDTMEYLREGVRFQAYGQRDPLVEYKREGYILFQKLLDKIKTDIVNTIFKVSVMAQNMPRPDTDSGQQNIHSAQKPFIHDKVGRNDPCPCGSGKKYKKCCGK
ncbi:preprotein translocase subunit SecA [bacterium (Candidatus Torokbacteria) CG09_land_8_20_14_0_10_42_11]|nr:MAG: preprotein translocase subunit SecA [bacterium (Candidatus Torokbacteria) CG09_land_8_20_14_0_10_42_11]